MQVVPPITLNSTEGTFTRAGTTATFIGSNGLLQTADANVLRTTYDPVTLECLGTLIEPAATNLLLNTAAPVNQPITTTAQTYTLSFYGSGTVTLTTSAAGVLVGSSTAARSTLVFTATAGTLNVAFSGTVTYPQIEAGLVATSYVVSTGSAGVRNADVFTGTAPALCYSDAADIPFGHAIAAWVSSNAYSAGTSVYRATTNCIYRCIKDITAASIPSLTTPEISITQEIPYWTQVDAVNWNSGTTYTFTTGEAKLVNYNKKLYQLIATTTVNTTLPSSTSPNYWVEAGPSNRWASFDLLRNSATKGRTQVTIVLKTGIRADTAVLVGMKGVRNAIITVYSAAGGGTLYTLNKDLTDRDSMSWYDYFFNPIVTRGSAVFAYLPPFTDALVSITLLGNDIELGGIIIGKAIFLGSVQRGIRSDAINFSSVSRDIFGNATMIQRRSIPKVDMTLYADTALVNTIRAARTQLNAVPAAWIGLEDVLDQPYFETMLVIGFYKNFTINIDNPINILVNLELEEI